MNYNFRTCLAATRETGYGLWVRGASVRVVREAESTRLFHSEDLAAIGVLSVSVPASTARKLLEDPIGILPARLFDCRVEASRNRQSPSGSWLWQEAGAFNTLFDVLNREAFPGVGTVISSKLLAAAFPELIPIRDSTVQALLDWDKQSAWWEPMHALLASTSTTLGDLEIQADVQGVTLLRKLDVLLWMEAADRDLG